GEAGGGAGEAGEVAAEGLGLAGARVDADAGGGGEGVGLALGGDGGGYGHDAAERADLGFGGGASGRLAVGAVGVGGGLSAADAGGREQEQGSDQARNRHALSHRRAPLRVIDTSVLPDIP